MAVGYGTVRKYGTLKF